MRYKEQYIEKVLSKTNIVDVISKYTDLQKTGEFAESGNFYIGNCPLHKDDKKSMMVYEKDQVFHCFDCGKGGNAAVFLMEMKDLSMSKAVDILARDVGIKPTEQDIAKRTNDILKSNMYDMYKDAAMFYRDRLTKPDGKEALEYLKSRELTDTTIKAFGLGYAPEKGNILYKYLKAKGYTDELMIEGGLVKVSETGPYDMFRNRVMFPIMNEQRRVIAFGGRRLSDDTEKTRYQPKYLNSPETIIFNKSNTLYGVHDLKGAERRYFLLCEGYMDVISLHQAGFKNAVATLGTAFTNTHIPAVQKFTNNLILTFDSDGAGQKAAMRTINALEDSAMGVRVLSMHPCKDPDEFIKQFGAQEYRSRISRSVDKVDFQLRFLASQYDLSDPQQKQEYLSSAVESILSKTRVLEKSIERGRG